MIKAQQTILNSPFPSSPEPLFQNEGRCSAFDMEISFYSHAKKTHFQKKNLTTQLIPDVPQMTIKQVASPHTQALYTTD